jgi:hypothetical protein
MHSQKVEFIGYVISTAGKKSDLFGMLDWKDFSLSAVVAEATMAKLARSK